MYNENSVKFYHFSLSSRFFVGEIAGKLDPCHVYNTIAWGTNSINHLNKSHLATEDFYKNMTHCVITNSDGINLTVNPTEMLTLPFVS